MDTFRTGDSPYRFAYRFGGEEFLGVLPEQTLKSASVAAERLRATVEVMGIPHEGYVPPGTVTVSDGVATLAPGEDKPRRTSSPARWPAWICIGLRNWAGTGSRSTMR